MNIPSFLKRKPESNKVDKNEKTINKSMRIDTEAGNPFIERKLQSSNQNAKAAKKEEEPDRGQRTHKIERVQTSVQVDESAVTVFKAPKTILYIKQLTKTLWQLRQHLQQEYDQLLGGRWSTIRSKQLSQLLSSNYFRFRRATFVSVLQQYSNVIQGLQLLISKLTNNQKLSERVLIRNQQDFVLFFKFFFSKPYTLINLPAVRKIIRLLWDQFLFSSLTVPAMIVNLRLWIVGIAAPLNPSMNKLHKISTERSEEISKLITHKSNAHVYIGVNDSDTLCLTPLMVAVIAGNMKGVQKLIKNGADLFCCPLTTNTKNVVESMEQSKFGSKLLIKKEFGFKERRQPDVIEYLKQSKRMDEIAHILCWESFYNLKKLRKDGQLSDLLELFPDCSFQIDWKEYRGMLCFKELPQDVITVSKRDYSLRIDFHVRDLAQGVRRKGFYSLILTAEAKEQNKLFLISHGDKSILNVLQDKDVNSIKQKFGLIMRQGNVFNLDVSELKSIYFPEDKRLSSSFQMYYQNYTGKHGLPRFKSEKEYFKALVESEIINYAQLQKNEMKAILEQTVVKVDKQKSKFVESSCNLDVEWSEQELNLSHLQLVLRLVLLAIPQSLLLVRLKRVLEIFQDPVFRVLTLKKKLPMHCKWSVQGQVNIQTEIKNLYYCKLDKSIFGLQIRAKEMNFEQAEQRVDLSHMQDTVFMDEMYSINASRFMGRSELLQEKEDEQANRKFEELLKLQGLWSNDEEDQK